MSLRDVRLWTTVGSVALVLLLVLWDSERTSPGPLSATHAQVAGLAAAEACDRCHGGWFQSMDGACVECHEPIRTQLEQGRGLHGALADAQDCVRCHSEHHGDEFALAGNASFALAGFERLSDFDHGHVEFGLEGRHGELTCSECHPLAEVAVLPAGERRFLGLDQDCASCHEDPHDGRFARSCQSCHGQELPFAALASFVHTASFPLTGGHAPAEQSGAQHCDRCHEPGGRHSIEALGGPGPPPEARGCADCHGEESPHDRRFLAEVAALGGVAPEAGCALCHDAEHGSFRGERVTVTAELHALTGFALEAPHADLACAACHGGQGDFGARHPGRAYAACASCHEDPHAGQFERGGFAGEGCLACHRERAFQPPSFDLGTHARTAFPLEGAHRAVACAACHARADEGAPRAFSGTPSACEACHQDPHAPVLAGSPGRGAAAPIAARGCASCHLATSFSELVPGSFEHGRDAGFALTGAHAEATCAQCHRPGTAPGRGDAARIEGRAFGVARSTGCAGCHASVHDAFFAGEDCATCHLTGAFSERTGPLLEAGWHAAWTGYPLEGAHARADCAGCHGVYPDPELAGRRLGRVAQLVSGPLEGCAGCHGDPHAGAFERAALPDALVDADGAVREGCARCHDTESFTSGSELFDHGLWTGHALRGAHAALECAACHQPLVAPGPGGRGFARAPGSACADCHADPHVGQFRDPAGDGPADCARCHLEEGSFERLDFDHQRDSRFALDASHARLECGACHRPWPLPGGGEAVRYRPLGTTCVDCHDHGGGRGR